MTDLPAHTLTNTPKPARAMSLWEALEGRSLELELAITRLGLAVSAVCMFISIVWTIFVAPEMAAVLIGGASVGVVWFALSGFLLSRGEFVAQVRWANPIFEVFIPGLAMVSLVQSHGPTYALGSWVPPMLYTVFVLASVLRLRPIVPLVIGVLAGLEFLAIYYAMCAPDLVGATDLLVLPRVQWVRALSLALAGVAGSGGVLALKVAVETAGADVRKHELFGKYRLVAKIASGGMGAVWEAVYSPEGGFSRQVAIKVVHAHLAQDAEFIDRFRAEAELTARLTHPNIVATLDFGAVDDTYFLAMEFVDGPTLREVREHVVAADIPLHPAMVAHIGRELAEGLHFAHAIARDAKGRPLRVVHRDLSPANVLLDRSGQVKISDFGVARVLGAQQQVVTSTLTGKPAYMAPEQLRQDPFDPRADLFSLGIILWELLCGRRLFLRDGHAQTMIAVLEDRIPLPTEIRPELADHWDALIARALARDPADRFQTATELSAALRDVLLAEGGVGPDAVGQLVLDVTTVEELPLDFTSEEAFLDQGLATGEVPRDESEPVAEAGSGLEPPPPSHPSHIAGELSSPHAEENADAPGPPSSVAASAPDEAPAIAAPTLESELLSTADITAALPDPVDADPADAEPFDADPVDADPDPADKVDWRPPPADPLPYEPVHEWSADPAPLPFTSIDSPEPEAGVVSMDFELGPPPVQPPKDTP